VCSLLLYPQSCRRQTDPVLPERHFFSVCPVPHTFPSSHYPLKGSRLNLLVEWTPVRRPRNRNPPPPSQSNFLLVTLIILLSPDRTFFNRGVHPVPRPPRESLSSFFYLNIPFRYLKQKTDRPPPFYPPPASNPLAPWTWRGLPPGSETPRDPPDGTSFFFKTFHGGGPLAVLRGVQAPPLFPPLGSWCRWHRRPSPGLPWRPLPCGCISPPSRLNHLTNWSSPAALFKHNTSSGTPSFSQLQGFFFFFRWFFALVPLIPARVSASWFFDLPSHSPLHAVLHSYYNFYFALRALSIIDRLFPFSST